MFDIAEHQISEVASQLNSLTCYWKGPVDMKVFIMERICSLILAVDRTLSVASYDFSRMPWLEMSHYPFREELFRLNALKLAFAQTNEQVYLRQFYDLRKLTLRKCDPSYVGRDESHFF
jgi:hypothetical protein